MLYFAYLYSMQFGGARSVVLESTNLLNLVNYSLVGLVLNDSGIFRVLGIFFLCCRNNVEDHLSILDS